MNEGGWGRYFEDFEEGATYDHWPGRTITQSDNTWFTLLTMNTHPLHFDAEYGRRTGFGRVLVNSTLTMAMVTGMSVKDTSQRTTANLGWDEVRLTSPVFVGDTIYASTEVLEKRESRSREGEGVVKIRTTGWKVDEASGKAAYEAEEALDPKVHGEVFLTFTRAFLAPLRGGAVDDKFAWRRSER